MKCAPADAADCCWICLQEGDLIQPCKCPRPVHKQCLASWQLHAAGTREETQCRFCNAVLPDWKPVLSGKADPTSALPVVAVVWCGAEYRLAVQPTRDGLTRFKRQVEVITGVPFNDELEVKFFCRSPAGYNLQLKGTNSLEAAMHCAAMTAANREQQPRSLERQQAGDILESSRAQPSCMHADVDGTATIIEPDLQDNDIMRYWRATVQAEQAELRRNIAGADSSSSDSSGDSTDTSTGSSTSSNNSRSSMIDVMNISSTIPRNRFSSGGASSSGNVSIASDGARVLTTHSSASSANQALVQSAHNTGWPIRLSRRRTLSVNLVLDVQPPEPVAGLGVASCLPFGLSSVVSSIFSWWSQ